MSMEKFPFYHVVLHTFFFIFTIQNLWKFYDNLFPFSYFLDPSVVFNITRIIEIAEGETAQLECSVDGNPLNEDTITWRRKNATGPPLVYLNSELGHSILTISNITRKDAGTLECIADNGVGLSSIGTAKLTVLCKYIFLFLHFDNSHSYLRFYSDIHLFRTYWEFEEI